MSTSLTTIRRIKKSVKRWLFRISQPRLDPQRLTEQLASLGLRHGDSVLVHGSLSALGFVPGGPAVVIQAIRDALGVEGTLLMPTHTYDLMSKGCRVFDLVETPSRVGAITECFRRMPGVMRSLHPTHSVAALGPAAATLLADHQLADTPCGPHTPYVRLMDMQGKILMLGIDIRRNTSFYAVEALAGCPHLRADEDDEFTLIDANRQRHVVRIRRHRHRIARRFAELGPPLLKAGVARQGPTGAGQSVLVDAAAMRDYLLPRLLADRELLLAHRAGDSIENAEQVSPVG